MNITHAKEEKVTTSFTEAIFNRQKELMEKYHHIEASTGLLQTPEVPVNLHSRRGQARIKDFAWRVMEEVGEALDAYEHSWVTKDVDYTHFLEELVDGLHFLTELTILSGIEPKTLARLGKDDAGEEDPLQYLMSLTSYSDSSIEAIVYGLVKELGMLCNTLKNKLWKQTEMLTDIGEYTSRLRNTWICYLQLFNFKDLTLEDVTMLYLKKSQVNKFRQGSNY